MLAQCLLAAVLAIGVTAQPGANACLVLSGGPSDEVKEKAGTWMKENYIQGEVFPEGCGFTDCPPAKCVICEGAYLGISNTAADSAKYSITDDELDSALDDMNNGGTGCVVNVKSQYVQVGFGNLDDFDGGDDLECDKC